MLRDESVQKMRRSPVAEVKKLEGSMMEKNACCRGQKSLRGRRTPVAKVEGSKNDDGEDRLLQRSKR